MVPSMSETTIESVSSQKKMLAVQAVSPESERENVMEFFPDFKFNCFYGTNFILKKRQIAYNRILTS